VGHPGDWNMALDDALLQDADRTGRPTLRLYRWSPPCLSFGQRAGADAL
jgi:lipoate-protein ligase A